MTDEKIVSLDRAEQMLNLFGSIDENLKAIEREYNVVVVSTGGNIKINGDVESVDKASRALDTLSQIANRGETINEQIVRYVISMVEEGNEAKVASLGSDCVCITAKGKPIKAKTIGQKDYLNAIAKNTITLAVGPAGTGKTYLAVALAVNAFRKKEISRIIITRPAVETGEKLGFLPGDIQSKVDPYLRPIYDALHDMMGTENYQKYVEKGAIEVAPLAYMRGRTLDDAYIILDEAQNTTPEQMKMFLTRLGFGSKAVITGDVTQIDLPTGKKSGLKEAVKILEGIEDIAICKLTDRDVVRHQLVQRIIRAYEKYENGQLNHSHESQRGVVWRKT